MNIKYQSYLQRICLILFGLINFWIFSRFTIDDAFITWRYGNNFIEHGIWNYNPSLVDPVQAYTNPLFALIGVVPAFINADVVMFFKIMSLITLVLCILWVAKHTKNQFLIYFFLLSPASIIHIFSGLETFVFCFFVFILYVNLLKGFYKSSVAVSLLLFLVRPEAWVFLFLVPMYCLTGNDDALQDFIASLLKFKPKVSALTFTPFFISLLILSSFLGIYFLIHHHMFGSALPNTFYIKKMTHFSLPSFLWFMLCSLPAVTLIYFRMWRLALVAVIYSLVLSYRYASSDLMMNYAGRFSYHIFAPNLFISLYVLSLRSPMDSSVKDQTDIQLLSAIKCKSLRLVMFFLVLGSIILSLNKNTLRLISYSSRLNMAHVQLGKALRTLNLQNHVSSFVFGDAGVTAYLSGISALDTVGLCSTLVRIHGGVTPEILEIYEPDLIIFHANSHGVRLDDFDQKITMDWVLKKNMVHIGNIAFNNDYIL